MATATIDLMPFCQQGECFYTDILQPFVARGWRYATDAKIAIRVPATNEPDTILQRASVHSVCQYFTDEYMAGEFTPMPLDLPASVKEVSCDECNGSGDDFQDCTTCDGKKCVPTTGEVLIGEAAVSFKHYVALKELPGITYRAYLKNGTVFIAFKFDGGEAILMSATN